MHSEVGQVDLHARIGQPHFFAVRPDDPAARGQPARRERPGGAVARLPIVAGDVEKRLEAGNQACIGGVLVNLYLETWFRSHYILKERH